MAKVPAMGRVKTRLARQAGAGEATRFYRHAMASVIGRLGRDPRWRTSLSIAPDSGVGARVWPSHLPRRPQGDGDLGSRMQRIMDRQPPGPLIIIGTDIPAIRPAHIAYAFAVLKGGDAVLGPAVDGGYWLVGLKRSPAILRPFEGVRWSSASTLIDTAANLPGHAIAAAAVLSDVDSVEDLRACRNWFGRRILPAR